MLSKRVVLLGEMHTGVGSSVFSPKKTFPSPATISAVEPAVASQHNQGQRQCFPVQCPLSQLCNVSRIPSDLSRPSSVQVMLGSESVLYVTTQ